MLALVLVFVATALALVGCDNGTTGGNDSGTVYGCAYSEKENTGHGTYYLLSISYADALSKLNQYFNENKRTQEPFSFQAGSSLSQRETFVILEDVANHVSMPDHVRLVQQVNGKLSGTSWHK